LIKISIRREKSLDVPITKENEFELEKIRGITLRQEDQTGWLRMWVEHPWPFSRNAR